MSNTKEKFCSTQTFWDTDLGYWIHQSGMLAIFLGLIFIPIGIYGIYFCEECTTYHNGFEYAKMWFPVSSFFIAFLMWMFHGDDLIKWCKTKLKEGKA